MSAVSNALNLTLVHSLWQHAIVAALLWAVLAFLRRRSPGSRYVAACAGLAVMLIASVSTFAALLTDAAPAPGVLSAPASEPRDVTAVTSALDTRVWASADVRQAWPAARAPEWLLPAWLVGVAIFSLRWSAAAVHAAALRRHSVRADDRIRVCVRRLACAMGVVREIDVRLAQHLASPGTIGWLRPIILVPPAVAMGLSTQHLEAVLAHEIAHIRRYDYLVNLAQGVVETLFFYHPAVWWVSGRIRVEREMCCDDAAVRACGDPLRYAQALTAIARGPSALQPVLSAGGGPLVQRVRRLLGHSLASQPASGWSALLVSCVAAAAIAAMTSLVEGQSGRGPLGSSGSLGTLTLVVYDPLGAPADDVPIVFEQGPFQQGTLFGEGRTNGNGRYTVHLPAGHYIFTAGIDFFPPTAVTLTAGATIEREVRMQLEPVTGSFIVCVMCPDDDSRDTLPDSIATELQRDRDAARTQLAMAAEPTGGWESFRPAAPRSLRERATPIEGLVVIEGVIGRDGSVSRLKTVGAPHFDLAAAAIAALAGQHWEPARVRGVSVEVPLRMMLQYVWDRAAR
jgi:beta-lactamase regulating signal transducer with metallopeptidase domain